MRPEPAAISVIVPKPVSFVRSLTFVGTVTLTVLLVIGNSTPFFWMWLIVFGSPPWAIISSTLVSRFDTFVSTASTSDSVANGSEGVAPLPSFVKSEVFVGTVISTFLLDIVSAVPFFEIDSITFTWAPLAIPANLSFSVVV